MVVLALPGESGATTLCGRVSLMGVSTPGEFRFIAVSKTVGRSWAPGGIVFLLGLPSGVLRGLMKLLMLFMVGVTGRGAASPARGGLSLLLLLLMLLLPGKKLDMKLAIIFFNPPQGVTWRWWRGTADQGDNSDRGCPPNRLAGGRLRRRISASANVYYLLVVCVIGYGYMCVCGSLRAFFVSLESSKWSRLMDG